METTHPNATSLDLLLQSRPRSSEDISTLVRVGSLLNSTLELREVLRIAMEEAARVMDAEASSVLLLDEKTGDLAFEVATGEKGEGVKEIRLRRGEGVAGWVAAHNRPVRVDDARDDPRFAGRVDQTTRFVTRSILCVPLRVKNRTIGVLEVINRRGGRPFRPEDEEFLVLLSHQMAAAIDNAQLYRRVWEERETLRAVLDSMADGVLMVESADRVLLHNPALLDWLDPGEGDLRLTALGDERVLRLCDRLAREGSNSLSFEMDLTRDGESRTLASTATALAGPGGVLRAVVLVLRDVTERARLEKMKNDFLAVTSHKLRTPLTAILSFASLLRRTPSPSSGGNPAELVESAAEAIETQGRYLHRLIEKLLTFSAMEQGMLHLEPESFDARALLAEALRALEDRAREAEIRLVCEPGPPVTVAADRRRILHLLTDLVENAVKFSPPGTRVAGSVDEAADEVHFRVSDQGPGIPACERERIFERFYQVDRDVTGQVEGAGLGLALCRMIAEAHGGRVEVESEPGRGSTFRLVLPNG